MMLPNTRHSRAMGSLVVLVGAVAVAVSGCTSPLGPDGGGNANADNCVDSAALDVIKRVDGMSTTERNALLAEEAAATRDGSIDFYTEINDPTAITDAFEDLYGDLTVNVYRAGSEQIRQRVLEESEARFAGSDLIEMDALEMAILDKNALLAPASSSHFSELSDAALFDNYTGDRLSYIVPVWNTTLLSPDEAPTSLEDLTDPRFKGKMALEGSDVFWFAGQVQHMEAGGMTRDAAVDVFRKIAANSAITSGHTTTTELVVAGQYAIAVNNFVHRALEYQEKGAPVEWAPTQIPVVAEVTTVSVPCLADNPAGALLLQDFILSADGGQTIFVDAGRTPSNSSLAQETLGGQKVEPIKTDIASIVENYAEWSSLWDEVVRGASAN